MKTDGGVDVSFHLFLTFALDAVKWSTACPPLYAWAQVPLYPLNRWLGEHQSQSRHFEEEQYLLPLPGIELKFLVHPGYSLVTTLIMLSWLFSHSICFILGHPSQPSIFGYSLELNSGSVPFPYFAMKQNCG
jgi:hypothetical protein